MSEHEFLDWLNQEPRMIKENPDKSLYVPISCVQEDLMTGFRGNTKFELIREVIGKGSMVGVGRLHYKLPHTNEWVWQDGSASLPFKASLRLDFPALGSHIMLNAAKKIGRRFGQLLNRDKDDAPIDLPVTQVEKTVDKEKERMELVLKDCKTKQELETFHMVVPKNLKKLYNSLLKSLPDETTSDTDTDKTN